jgi:hypothetical protein
VKVVPIAPAGSLGGIIQRNLGELATEVFEGASVAGIGKVSPLLLAGEVGLYDRVGIPPESTNTDFPRPADRCTCLTQSVVEAALDASGKEDWRDVRLRLKA